MSYTITKYVPIVPIQGDSPNICSYQFFPLRIYLNSDFYRMLDFIFIRCLFIDVN